MIKVFECPFRDRCQNLNNDNTVRFYEDDITYTLEAPRCIAPLLTDRYGNYLCSFVLDDTPDKLSNYRELRKAIRIYRPSLLERLRKHFEGVTRC